MRVYIKIHMKNKYGKIYYDLFNIVLFLSKNFVLKMT